MIRSARPVWLVARHEFLTHARRRSFLLTTLLLPAIGLAVSLGSSLAGAAAVGGGVRSVFELDDFERARDRARAGIVDPGGFVVRLPAGAEDQFVAFEAQAPARAALRADEIDVVYVLPADYPADTTVLRIHPGLPFERSDLALLRRLLRLNLHPDADPEWHADLAVPGRRIAVETVVPPAGDAAPGVDLDAEPVAAMAPLAVGLLLYFAIFMTSSFLLQSVTTEKESRLIEMLLTSVRPFHLLAGKVVGLGALGLLQVTVWAASWLALAGAGVLAAEALGLAPSGPELVVLGGAYFVLGYAFYASLMAAVGALVPTFQESGALTFVVLFPAWTPFFVLEALLAEPGGGLARALSLLPPTAPLVMMLRLSMGAAAPIEVALSLALLAVGALGVLWVAARLFRASVLLAGGVPGPRALLRALSR